MEEATETDVSRVSGGYIDIDAAIGQYDKTVSQKRNLDSRLAAVRFDLRNALSRGEVNQEQRNWIEMHIPRRRKTNDTCNP